MEQDRTDTAEAVLRARNWLPEGVHVTGAEIAGAGNMNLVERVHLSDQTSVILKRARAWVEKYPDIPAPIERAGVEAAFYTHVQGSAAGQAMPKHLAYDADGSVNLLQDIGAGADGMFVYNADAKLPVEQLHAVADWLSALHSLAITDDMRQSLENRSMRMLNAVHIFDFPLDFENGFDLDAISPGLQSVAGSLKADTSFVSATQEVRDRYLATSTQTGDVLLHGDLYPGSWLTTPEGLFVIDPEFCWIGPPEWDIGVLIAHLRLSQQPEDYTEQLVERYGRELDQNLLNKISGIEIMRRIIGVAQLPLAADLSQKENLLEVARQLVSEPVS